MFRKIFLIILVLNFAISVEGAFEDKVGVRALGMAGAFTAISDDTNALLWNPAGITQLKNPEISLMYAKPYLGLDYDSLNEGFIGYVQPLDVIGTFGISYLYFYSELYREQTATLSYARDIIKDNLSLGITGKLLGVSYIENEYTKIDPLFQQKGYTKTKIGIDAGVLCKLSQDLSFGVLAENINEPNISLGDDTQNKIPLQIKIGGAYKLGDFIPAVDISYRNKKINNKVDINVSAAMEWWNKEKTTALRGGINLREIAVGTSYILGDGGIDYAFSYPIGSISKTFGTHRIGLSWQFGRGKDIEKIKGERITRPDVPVIFATEKLSVAIVNLDAHNVSVDTAASVSNIFRTELFRTGRFIVMEREKMDAILKEQAFQMTGCTTTECAVEMGKLLNVKIIVIGSLDKLGEQYIINARLIDVEKGEIILAESHKCTSETELSEAIVKLTDKIALKIVIVGKVLQVKEDKIIVNLGTQDNIKVGQELSVSRLGEVVKDEQGRILMQKKEYIATIVVDYVGPQASESKILKSEKQIEIGDIVEIKE